MKSHIFAPIAYVVCALAIIGVATAYASHVENRENNTRAVLLEATLGVPQMAEHDLGYVCAGPSEEDCLVISELEVEMSLEGRKTVRAFAREGWVLFGTEDAGYVVWTAYPYGMVYHQYVENPELGGYRVPVGTAVNVTAYPNDKIFISHLGEAPEHYDSGTHRGE